MKQFFGRFVLLALVLPLGIFLGWWLRSSRDGPAGEQVVAPRLPPDVVIFSIDTLRADHLACYGYSRPTSPAIAALTGEAVLFRQVISPAPNTAPAHMTMLTGVSPAVHGVHNYADPDAPANVLPRTIPTMATLLRRHGYRTAGLTNSPNVSPALGFGQGFDEYTEDFFAQDRMYDEPRATEAAGIERLRGVLAGANRSRAPLFLFVHHYLCHRVYLAAPTGYRELFADALLADLPRSMAQLRGMADWRGNDDAAFFARLRGSDPRHRAHVMALYDGAIAYSDRTVELVVNELRAAGRWDNTLFILTSDHGEEFQEHGSWGHDQLRGEDLRVPLLLKLPGGAFAGGVVTQPVQTGDLARTVLAALRLPAPETMQGRSLLPLLAGETPPAPSLVSYQPAGNGRGAVIVNGMRVTAGGYTWFWHNGETRREYLFAASDTTEQHNLAAARPELCREMRMRAATQLAADRALRASLLASDTGPVE